MTSNDARELARVRNAMLVVWAIAWALMLVDPGGTLMAAHGAVGHAPLAPDTHAAHTLHATHGLHATHADATPLPVSRQVQAMTLASAAVHWLPGWILMLVAMMTPALIPPVRYLRLRSFAHRRWRALTLFAAAYVAIWVAAGALLVALALTLDRLAPQSFLPAALAILVAFVWQCAPVKQRCLNRCHAHPALAAFGTAADIDVLRFGVTHGLWCAGACWALMLVPLLLPQGHVAMAAATVLIVSERLDAPRPPRWHLRGPGNLLRILLAQTRLRLDAGLVTRRLFRVTGS